MDIYIILYNIYTYIYILVMGYQALKSGNESHSHCKTSWIQIHSPSCRPKRPMVLGLLFK